MPWYPFEDTFELEQAELSLFGMQGPIVVVEGKIIDSYEQLVKLAVQEEQKNKDFLDIQLYAGLIGGG